MIALSHLIQTSLNVERLGSSEQLLARIDDVEEDQGLLLHELIVAETVEMQNLHLLGHRRFA
jgi:L-ribulose-5-phosphate 3-epimerase UlaE